MKRLFNIVTFVISISGMAQTNLDSLLHIWNNPAESDTNRIKSMATIVLQRYLYSKPDSAFYYAQLQYDFSLKKGLKKYQAIALSIQGITLAMRGHSSKAVDYYTKALNLFETIGNKKNIASTLNNIGLIYNEKGDLVKAIDYYSRSLKIQEEIGDRSGAAIALANIGEIYLMQGDLENSLRYHTISLRISTEINYKQNITLCLNNLGAIYKRKGDLKKALDYFEQCLKIKTSINDKIGIALAISNIGGIYTSEGDYGKALEYYSKSLKLREGIGDKLGVANTLMGIGEIHQKKTDYQTAVIYYAKALTLAKEAGGVEEEKNSSYDLFECYRKIGRYKDALEMHEFFIAMRDSILSAANKEGMMKQEMQYSYEKQKALDEKQHDTEMAISNEKEQKQKIISYATMGGLILVMLFAFFVFTRLRVTAKQKKIIEEQKNLVEVKQKEILDSITYAKRLQEAILPPDNFFKELLPESFIFYQPKDIVAGDFYWMEKISWQETESRKQLEKNNSQLPSADCILIAVADCTGHGVPGAMVSLVCSNALNRSVHEFRLTDPGKILDKTRELVLETFAKSDKDVKDGMDISLCSIARSENNTTTIKWAGANNALWYLQNNEIKEIKSDKQPIGKTENPKPFTTHSLQLKKGDSVFLFTDGFADQFGGEKGKKFKYKPLKEMLQDSSLSLEAQKLKLETIFNEWKGNLEQVDDVCVIGIRL